VTSQARMDIVPTSASFVGIRMMEDPSMLSITAIVSCRQVIFGFSIVFIMASLVGYLSWCWLKKANPALYRLRRAGSRIF